MKIIALLLLMTTAAHAADLPIPKKRPSDVSVRITREKKLPPAYVAVPHPTSTRPAGLY